MNNKYKNYQDWKTSNPRDDVIKFEMVRNGNGKYFNKARNKQIEQVKQIHSDFPCIRFYDWHKQGRKFAEKYFTYYGYKKCSRLPDGYYFDYDEGIFIIEIENYSRLDKRRINDYRNWWDWFDCNEYIPLYLIEFNRFGKYQRDVIKESFSNERSIDILKRLSLKNNGINHE